MVIGGIISSLAKSNMVYINFLINTYNIRNYCYIKII